MRYHIHHKGFTSRLPALWNLHAVLALMACSFDSFLFSLERALFRSRKVMRWDEMLWLNGSSAGTGTRGYKDLITSLGHSSIILKAKIILR